MGNVDLAVRAAVDGATSIEQRLAIEHGATQVLADSSSLAEAAPKIIATVCETLGWECGACWVSAADNDSMHCLGSWGVAGVAVGEFLEVTRTMLQSRAPGGLIRRTWLAGEAVWLRDVTADKSFRRAPAALKAGLHSAFAFPVKAGSAVTGVIEFFSREIRQPDAELLDCMRYVGSQIGQFLKRIAAEEALRVSEARFRSLTELSSDWYWEQDTEQRFTKFEGRTRAGAKYNAAATLLGKSIWETPSMLPDSGDWSEHRATLERHEPFRDFEYSYRDRKGKQYHVAINGEPVFDESGAFSGYRGTSRDITERKRKEEELAQFRAAMDASPDMMYVTDRETLRFLYANETACRLTGFSLEELLARGPADVLRMDPKDVERTFDEAIAAGPAGTVQELKTNDKDGLRTMAEIRRRAVHLDGRWIVFTIAQDIGLRKRAEHEMLRSGRMFAALSATNEAIMRATSSEDLYKRVCEAAVDGGKLLTTAVVEPQPEAASARVVAFSGIAPPHLLELRVPLGETAHAPQGLIGNAFHTCAPCVSNDYLKDERTLSWHEEAREAGIASAAALPMLRNGEAIGVLLFYSGEKRAFDGEIVKLLERMAENVVFGLDNFAKDLQRRQAEKRVEYLATHDGLTGLPNRVLFSQLLNHAIDTSQRYKRSFAVLFIDLDGFKIINDTLGHQAGDQLLHTVSGRLKKTVRASDVVARLGGDEFVVLLQEVASEAQVAAAARKILAAVVKPFEIAGQECRVTASIGISMYPADAADERSLMKNADVAMYRAKEVGKNNFQIYSSEMKS